MSYICYVKLIKAMEEPTLFVTPDGTLTTVNPSNNEEYILDAVEGNMFGILTLCFILKNPNYE